MTQSNFGSPTQFEITEIKIDNQDVARTLLLYLYL